MNKNKWIVDRGYGSGMALGFQGDANFLRRSVNFAVNRLLNRTAQIKHMTDNFYVVNTSMEALRAALIEEGAAFKKIELLKAIPFVEPEYPENYEELVNAYVEAQLKGDESVKNPVFEQKIDEAAIDEQARAYGEVYAEEELAKLESDDFMTRLSHSSVVTHDIADFSLGQ